MIHFLRKKGRICKNLNCRNVTAFCNTEKGYNKYCSQGCNLRDVEVQSKRKQNWMERYGVDNPSKSKDIKEKKKLTWMEKYGVGHPMQSESTRERLKQTNLERYGVENVFQSGGFKEKRRQTCLKRYGFEYPLQSGEGWNKYRQTCLDHYGVEYPMQSEEVKERSRSTCLERHGVAFISQTENFRNRISTYMKNGGSARANSFIKSLSKPQVKIFSLVKEVYPDAVINHPCLNYCIDVVVPSLKIAIEYDCSYWHQDKEKDKERQQALEQQGWKFIRYRDCVPSKEELLEKIESSKE